MTTYHPLTEAEAVELARSFKDHFAAGAELACKEIGDGNLNLVFHITEPATGKGLILKQGLPYVKVFGESWPLSLERARIENEALVIQGELATGLTPKVYFYDADLALTAMEDLSDHIIMRKGLIERQVYPQFADDISTFLAQTLFLSSDLGMNQQEKKLRQKSFVNPDLCQITEELIFEEPYRDSERNNIEEHIQDEAAALRSDAELHLAVAQLREKFLTRTEALLHGDLHTGSIFVRPDSTKVIDPEFAFYGPMGFDIGAVIANLILNFAAQEHWSADETSREEFRSYLTGAIHDLWNGFYEKFSVLWAEQGVDSILRDTPGYRELYMKRLLQDTIGFAGTKIIRRVVGFAHVADIDSIPDAAARERAQRLAITIGKALIKHHVNATSIEEAIDIAWIAAAASK